MSRYLTGSLVASTDGGGTVFQVYSVWTMSSVLDVEIDGTNNWDMSVGMAATDTSAT